MYLSLFEGNGEEGEKKNSFGSHFCGVVKKKFEKEKKESAFFTTANKKSTLTAIKLLNFILEREREREKEIRARTHT